LRIAAVAAGLAVAWIAPAGAQAAGLDQTCDLTATRFDADTVNVLFPDSSAQYWSTRYVAVPGTRIRIDGIFPRSRYMSWNVYDPLLRPFAKKSDFELQPDPRSANPFEPGADRSTPDARRHYTLFITFSKDDHPGPNTIYVDPSKNPVGLITYRVYVPDRGRDITGDVGLPQVTWEPTSSHSAPGLASPCRHLEKPSVNFLTNLYASLMGPDAGPPLPGQPTPHWHRFVNLCYSGQDLLFDNPILGRLPSAPSPCASAGSGGFLSNMDNAYVYTGISRGYGPIVVFHGRAPTFADTYDRAQTMPSGEQLRYWSFCQNDPFDQRYIGCARDDQVPVDDGGDYTIVVSQPGDWPAAAKAACPGAAWIPWGPQPEGVVIYRNMLPAPDFAHAIQNVRRDHEKQDMGAYYPRGKYFAGWKSVAHAYC
jgi:hypothetical protein